MMKRPNSYLLAIAASLFMWAVMLVWFSPRLGAALGICAAVIAGLYLASVHARRAWFLSPLTSAALISGALLSAALLSGCELVDNSSSSADETITASDNATVVTHSASNTVNSGNATAPAEGSAQ